MFRTPPPLIARLRRRLSACVWVFALLVLGKSVVAMACQTDGWSSGAVAANVSVTTAVSDTASDAHATTDSDADADRCFHAAAGGCHCACSHSTALTTTPWLVFGNGPPPLRPTTVAVAPRPAPLHPSLRPPIA